MNYKLPLQIRQNNLFTDDDMREGFGGVGKIPIIFSSLLTGLKVVAEFSKLYSSDCNLKIGSGKCAWNVCII
jgi:hypothetical protein